MTETDFRDLIPELPHWNNGAGITAEDWIGCVGNYELAVGYSLVFWPAFVEFEGYVLRGPIEENALRSFESCEGATRQGVEALLNHLHIADLHYNADQPSSEAQLRYLGRILKATYEAKLARDFPGRSFMVEFNDEPGLEPLGYQLTFYRIA